MSLKAVVESLDQVAEPLRPFYTEKEGRFVLDAEVDSHPSVHGLKSALEKEREGHKAAKGELSKYSGVDLEEVTRLREEAQKARDKKLIDAGKVEELVNERVSRMKADYDKQIEALTNQNKGATIQLEKLLIDTAIQDAAAKAGVRPTALEDVLLRARSTFRIQDGQAVPFQGDKALYGKDGQNYLSVPEWVEGLAAAAPHLFGESKGSGAPGGKPSAAPTNQNLSPTDKIRAGLTSR